MNKYKCKILGPTNYIIGDICHLKHIINESCYDIDNDVCEDYCYSGAMG